MAESRGGMPFSIAATSVEQKLPGKGASVSLLLEAHTDICQMEATARRKQQQQKRFLLFVPCHLAECPRVEM